MRLKIQTLKDINLYLAEELKELYPANEISAFANIIRTNFGFTKLQVAAYPDIIVPPAVANDIIAICSELKTGRPLQYVLGETTFYNCTINLNSSTLIPRPETEELVDLIIKENRGFTGSILDIGTGSGAIAIALSINLPGSSVTGTDISLEAIKKAVENGRLNGSKARFLFDDIFNSSPSIFTGVGIIVSNPPYVRESEKNNMSKNVLDFEPHSALFVPDEDPFRYYAAILKMACRSLTGGGKIYFEINEALGGETADMASSYGFCEVMIVKDLNGKDRFIKALRNG
jgi:release factor glutamine methyltransferase